MKTHNGAGKGIKARGAKMFGHVGMSAAGESMGGIEGEEINKRLMKTRSARGRCRKYQRRAAWTKIWHIISTGRFRHRNRRTAGGAAVGMA